MKRSLLLATFVALLMAGAGTSRAAEKQDGCVVESVILQCVENGVDKKVTLLGRDPAIDAQVDALTAKVGDVSVKLRQSQEDNAKLQAQMQKVAADRDALLERIKQIGSFFNGNYAGAAEKEAQSPFEVEKKSERTVVPAPPQATQPATGVATQPSSYIRSTPDKSAAIVATVHKGDRFKVVQDVGGGWYKVLYLGKTGYVSAKTFTFALD